MCVCGRGVMPEQCLPHSLLLPKDEATLNIIPSSTPKGIDPCSGRWESGIPLLLFTSLFLPSHLFPFVSNPAPSRSRHIQTPELLLPSSGPEASPPSPGVCNLLKIKACDSRRQLRKYTIQPRHPPGGGQGRTCVQRNIQTQQPPPPGKHGKAVCS